MARIVDRAEFGAQPMFIILTGFMLVILVLGTLSFFGVIGQKEEAKQGVTAENLQVDCTGRKGFLEIEYDNLGYVSRYYCAQIKHEK